MSFNPYKSWLKISGADGAPNHYDLLGLPCFEADVDRIRQAYRERYAHVRRYEVGDHGESAIRLMEELSKSLVLLTDPDKKAAYDKQLRESGEREEVRASLLARRDEQEEQVRGLAVDRVELDPVATATVARE